MNMSYCRFENTLRDLGDCEDFLFDDLDELSKEETKARKRLIEMCHRIAEVTEDEIEDLKF